MSSSPDRPRIAAAVALTLLEVIRDQDRPTEILESENPSETMPRKLGLSEVVERKIRNYREEVRKGSRITDDEFGDLIRLVIRRPDSPEVFFQAGELLADGNGSRASRLLPSRVTYWLARRRVTRRMKSLFGRRLGGFGSGPFTLEGRTLPFIQNDPGGDACSLITGLCQGMLGRYLRSRVLVVHNACESNRDPFCRWVMVEQEPSAVEAG